MSHVLERIFQCGQSSGQGSVGFQEFPDLVFWQNLITREAALDLGSGNGVQGSLSSILASKGTCHLSFLPWACFPFLCALYTLVF